MECARTAATVADTKEHKSLFAYSVIFIITLNLLKRARHCRAVICIFGAEMSKHTCAVDTHPVKCMVRMFVMFTPGKLLCYKIVNTAELKNLRKCGTVAKNIGQPE